MFRSHHKSSSDPTKNSSSMCVAASTTTPRFHLKAPLMPVPTPSVRCLKLGQRNPKWNEDATMVAKFRFVAEPIRALVRGRTLSALQKACRRPVDVRSFRGSRVRRQSNASAVREGAGHTFSSCLGVPITSCGTGEGKCGRAETCGLRAGGGFNREVAPGGQREGVFA